MNATKSVKHSIYIGRVNRPPQHKISFNVKSLIMKSTKPGVNANQEGLTVVGSAALDHTIIGLCPEIKELSDKQIQYISRIIRAYIIGGEDAIDTIEIIEEIVNKDVAEFIEEIGMIARKEGIETIEGIEAHIRSLEKSFNTSIVCGQSEIPGEEGAEFSVAISSVHSIK